MDHVVCGACGGNVLPRAPSRSYVWLIVTFWGFSLLFGIGATMAPGWSFPLLLAWLLLACTASVMLQRAMSWTCPRCGAALELPPQSVGAVTSAP